MTTAHPLAPEIRRVPVLVVLGFYLWVPLIVAQSIVLAYTALTLAQAARIGGPAWDVIFVDPPIAISLLLLVTLEVGFAISMRGGSRGGRILLLLLAVLNAAFAFLVGVPSTGTRMPVVQVTAQVLASSVAFNLDLTLKVLCLVALAGSVLPFLPGASAYFAKRPSTNADALPGSVAVSEEGGIGEPIPSADEQAVQDAGSVRRRPRPWQVILAFILWWPLILMQVAALVYLGSTIAYYLGMSMGSVVTLLFIVGAGVPLVGVAAAEIVLDIALFRGGRGARWWLLGLATSTLLLAAWPAVTVALAEIAGTHGGIGGGDSIAVLSGIAGTVVLLALLGTALTFLPHPNRYFARTASPAGPSSSHFDSVKVLEGKSPASP